MGTITTADGTEIFYKDWGTGQPIMFSHSGPLSADDWDKRMLFWMATLYACLGAATASRHLTLMTDAELLIATRKKGWTFCRRDEPAIHRFTDRLKSDL